MVECLTDSAHDLVLTCSACASYDLALKTNDDGWAIVLPGQALTYAIEVANLGPTAVIGAKVLDTFPLQAVGWTCVGNGGASCTASGSGDISDTVTLPVGSRVAYTATGMVPLAATGTLSNEATVAPPAGATDPDPWNNSVIDVNVIGGPGAALGFFTVAPCRVVDTRNDYHPPGPSLPAQQTRVFAISDDIFPFAYCGIPLDAKALSLNVAVAEPASAGNVRLFPAGQCVPTVSTVSYGAGMTRSSNAIVPLNAGGEFGIFVGQPTGRVHVILDVNGYFR